MPVLHFADGQDARATNGFFEQPPCDLLFYLSIRLLGKLLI